LSIIEDNDIMVPTAGWEWRNEWQE